MESAGGIFFLNLASVVAEDFRGFRPEMASHRSDMAANVMRQIDVIVFPDDKDFSPRQPGEGVELLGEGSEAALDTDDLPACAGLVL